MKRLFGWMLLITAMCSGCATTAKVTTPAVAIVKTCAPPTPLFSALVLDAVDGAATLPIALAQVEILAAQTAICTVTQIAKDIIAEIGNIQLTAPVGPPSMRRQWAQAWIAAHPQ